MVAEGVDLGKPEAIQQYMAQMEEEDPQRFEMFSILMDKLMSPMEEQGEMQEQGEQPEQQFPEDLSGMPSQQGAAPMDLSQVPQEGQQPQ